MYNDLDVVVKSGDKLFRGNGGLQADFVNNVEKVFLVGGIPDSSTITVEVIAFRVPVGKQGFALAVTGTVGNSFPAKSLQRPIRDADAQRVVFRCTYGSLGCRYSMRAT